MDYYAAFTDTATGLHQPSLVLKSLCVCVWRAI